ncbi:Histone deacetylation protein Rxt3 [Artemisia annua]|uniref:Histone deacetylation protein Rxt3 n=1 Tax=Artemisia annua TaxID=35608 RepID=A0A2U1L933_ARTAN|nr:Histone deacetylation protein Rxt3 [Artemisia annua]
MAHGVQRHANKVFFLGETEKKSGVYSPKTKELLKLWKEYESAASDKLPERSNGRPTIEIRIPAEHVKDGQLWGTDVYTDDSDLVSESIDDLNLTYFISYSPVLMHTGFCRPTASPPPFAIQELRDTVRVLPPQIHGRLYRHIHIIWLCYIGGNEPITGNDIGGNEPTVSNHTPVCLIFEMPTHMSSYDSNQQPMIGNNSRMEQGDHDCNEVKSIPDSRLKKGNGKAREHVLSQTKHKQYFLFGQSDISSPEVVDSFEAYSPMDTSPYQETFETRQLRRARILSPVKTQKYDMSLLFDKGKDNFKPVNKLDLKHGNFSTASANIAAEACEKWRLRWNPETCRPLTSAMPLPMSSETVPARPLGAAGSAPPNAGAGPSHPRTVPEGPEGVENPMGRTRASRQRGGGVPRRSTTSTVSAGPPAEYNSFGIVFI